MGCSIHELRYSATNTYLIQGERGQLLLDTGWAGTFPAFCQECGDLGVSVQSIDYILITHFHPDHMGIAQEIANLGPAVVVADVQQEYVHAADAVFAKESKHRFTPIDDSKVKTVALAESRKFLEILGIEGEILYTPGHSDDSISLWLDEGTVFVGDLNPLYELELHQGDLIEKSWNKILERQPGRVYYGHARAADLEAVYDKDQTVYSSGCIQTSQREEHVIQQGGDDQKDRKPKNSRDLYSDYIGSSLQYNDLYRLTERIMKYIDKGISIERIQRKTGADLAFIENVARMYLTHQNVGVQGILDRIELRGKNR